GSYFRRTSRCSWFLTRSSLSLRLLSPVCPAKSGFGSVCLRLTDRSRRLEGLGPGTSFLPLSGVSERDLGLSPTWRVWWTPEDMGEESPARPFSSRSRASLRAFSRAFLAFPNPSDLSLVLSSGATRFTLVALSLPACSLSLGVMFLEGGRASLGVCLSEVSGLRRRPL